MGAEISQVFISPIAAVLIIGLSVLAITKQNEGQTQTARWLGISSTILTILLIILIVFVTMIAA